MNDLTEKLVRELEIRNFSKNTVKSYSFSVESYLKYILSKKMNKYYIKISQASIKNVKSPLDSL